MQNGPNDRMAHRLPFRDGRRGMPCHKPSAPTAAPPKQVNGNTKPQRRMQTKNKQWAWPICKIALSLQPVAPGGKTAGAGEPSLKYVSEMKNRLKDIGIALVTIGALLLVASYFAGWTDNNKVLLSGLGLIMAGIIMHVAAIKHESKY